MAAKEESLDDARHLLAIHSARTLSSAAKVLGVNASTVFRRLRRLEERLEASLIEKSGEGYVLTERGLGLLPLAQDIERSAHAFERAAAGGENEMHGILRLTTVPELAHAALPALLRNFVEEHPGIQLDVVVERKVLSLARREADVAIRPGTASNEGESVARRVCGMAFALYASRYYVEKFGRPNTLSELNQHRLVRGDARTLSYLPSENWLSENAASARIAYTSNELLHLSSAVLAGIGIAMLPCFLCEREPTLVRLWEPVESCNIGIVVAYHRDMRRSVKVNALVAFLRRALAEQRSLFEGPELIDHIG